MTTIAIIFFIVTTICLAKVIWKFKAMYESKKKEKQFYQLRRIYQYFIEAKSNPHEAKSKLSKDIKIENKWLYTNYFYFNLSENNVFEKIKKYLLEIMSFSLGSKYMANKNILNSMVELKKELNEIA